MVPPSFRVGPPCSVLPGNSLTDRHMFVFLVITRWQFRTTSSLCLCGLWGLDIKHLLLQDLSCCPLATSPGTGCPGKGEAHLCHRTGLRGMAGRSLGPASSRDGLLYGDSMARSFSGCPELSSLRSSPWARVRPDVRGWGLSLSTFSALPGSPPTMLLPSSSITIGGAFLGRRLRERIHPGHRLLLPALGSTSGCRGVMMPGLQVLVLRWEAIDPGRLWESSSLRNILHIPGVLGPPSPWVSELGACSQMGVLTQPPAILQKSIS